MISLHTFEDECDEMAYAKLEFSRKEVNQAGATLKATAFQEQEWLHALDVTENFRAAHAFPLNTLRNALRSDAMGIDANCIIAQRLKRWKSIYGKLLLFPKMKLWDMQDIGGCRAIVHTVEQVRQLTQQYKSSRMRRTPAHEDDYIQNPPGFGVQRPSLGLSVL